MSKITVVFNSYRGVSERLVEALSQGVAEAGGEVTCKLAREATIADLIASDVFVLASGQPFGSLSGPMKAFLESCWMAPERQQLQGKAFTYILNGSNDPAGSGAYVEKVATYFKWSLAAPGILTTAEKASEVGDRARQMGLTLAKLPVGAS